MLLLQLRRLVQLILLVLVLREVEEVCGVRVCALVVVEEGLELLVVLLGAVESLEDVA